MAMAALDPFIVTIYTFFGCMFAGFGLAFASKNHRIIGGSLILSAGITFLLLAYYCFITAITPVTL